MARKRPDKKAPHGDVIYVRLHPDEGKRLRALADAASRTISGEVQQAVRAHLARSIAA